MRQTVPSIGRCYDFDITVGDKVIKSDPYVKLLRVFINMHMNFSYHTGQLYNKGSLMAFSEYTDF